jgi:hypothetical protein
MRMVSIAVIAPQFRNRCSSSKRRASTKSRRMQRLTMVPIACALSSGLGRARLWMPSFQPDVLDSECDFDSEKDVPVDRPSHAELTIGRGSRAHDRRIPS